MHGARNTRPRRRELITQRRIELQRPLQPATQSFADAYGKRGRRLVVVAQIEMRIEGRRLVDLGNANAQQIGQRHQVARTQATATVLESVQVFEQQVAA